MNEVEIINGDSEFDSETEISFRRSSVILETLRNFAKSYSKTYSSNKNMVSYLQGMNIADTRKPEPLGDRSMVQMRMKKYKTYYTHVICYCTLTA